MVVRAIRSSNMICSSCSGMASEHASSHLDGSMHSADVGRSSFRALRERKRGGAGRERRQSGREIDGDSKSINNVSFL